MAYDNDALDLGGVRTEDVLGPEFTEGTRPGSGPCWALPERCCWAAQVWQSMRGRPFVWSLRSTGSATTSARVCGVSAGDACDAR